MVCNPPAAELYARGSVREGGGGGGGGGGCTLIGFGSDVANGVVEANLAMASTSGIGTVLVIGDIGTVLCFACTRDKAVTYIFQQFRPHWGVLRS